MESIVKWVLATGIAMAAGLCFAFAFCIVGFIILAVALVAFVWTLGGELI